MAPTQISLYATTLIPNKYFRLIGLKWCKDEWGKFLMSTSTSLLLVHSTAKLAYGTKKFSFAPSHLPRKPAPLNYKHHPNVSQPGSTRAALQGLPWGLGAGETPALPALLPCSAPGSPPIHKDSPTCTEVCSAQSRTTWARKHLSIQQWFSRKGEIFGKLYSWKSYEWHKKENMAFIAIWEKKKGPMWFWVLWILVSWHIGKIIRSTHAPKTRSTWAHALADTFWIIKVWHLKMLLPLSICPLLLDLTNLHSTASRKGCPLVH